MNGPKACGKTATASRHAQTVIHLDEDATARNWLHLAPERLFDSPTPILFDEWQVEPTIWNKVRRQVDDRDGKGIFILTGSATPTDDASRHSGAGRFAVMKMRPMSLFESGHSNGEMSLASLLRGERQTGLGTHLTFDELLTRIVVGGWPELIGVDETSARRWLHDYLSNIVEVDIQKLVHGETRPTSVDSWSHSGDQLAKQSRPSNSRKMSAERTARSRRKPCLPISPLSIDSTWSKTHQLGCPTCARVPGYAQLRSATSSIPRSAPPHSASAPAN